MLSYLEVLTALIIVSSLMVIGIGIRFAFKSDRIRNSKSISITLTLFGLITLSLGLSQLVLQDYLIQSSIEDRNQNIEIKSQIDRLNRNYQSLKNLSFKVDQIIDISTKKQNSILNYQDNIYKNISLSKDAIDQLSGEVAWLKLMSYLKLDQEIFKQTISGTYYKGEELTIFEPCSNQSLYKEESWEPHFYISAEDKDRVSKVIGDSFHQPKHIHATGIVSALGEFGHMGANKRLFIITDVESREKSDCRYHFDPYQHVFGYYY